MRRFWTLFWVVFFLWELAAGAGALTITVNGTLSDWGLNTSSFGKNGNHWDPGIPGVFVWQEDEVGSGGYVGPAYGGQNYDVEAVLATFDDENLYVAIATGFPQAGRDGWDAGDIAFDLGDDGTWDYALVISNYLDGVETRGLTLGGFYEVTNWQDVYYSGHSESNPFRMANGTLLETTDFAYVDDPDHSFPRYFIEAAIPLSLFGGPVHEVTIHWTMECGNDYGEVVAHTPEPASILLAGAGLFAVSMFLRRRRREG